MRGLVLALWLVAAPAAAWEPLNTYREGQGLAPLERAPALEEMAARHASDMAEKGYFAHVSPDGRGLTERARAVGYRYCSLAENIALGQRSPDEVFASWRNSAPHRENMRLPDVTEYGLARAQGDYWVLVLGRPGC